MSQAVAAFACLGQEPGHGYGHLAAGLRALPPRWCAVVPAAWHLCPCCVSFVCIAGVALKQFTIAEAMRHKAVVMEVACNAHVHRRSSLLGAHFDEVARREWETRSQNLGASFFVGAAMGRHHDDLLRRAQDKFDAWKSSASAHVSCNL